MYAVTSRPDIATATSICARYLSKPTTAHMTAARRVLDYLATTPTLGLQYTIGNPELTCYVDASWADDKDTRRTRYGFAIYLGNNLIAWRSKLHPSIALSTAEAEYIAASQATKTIKYLRYLLKELGIPQNKPTILYEDNEACIAMTKNKMVTGRSKHIELKQHYVREQVGLNNIELQYIPTKQQRADLLTKNLPRPAFESLRQQLMQPTTNHRHDVNKNTGS